jgi:hypothetical protein
VIGAIFTAQGNILNRTGLCPDQVTEGESQKVVKGHLKNGVEGDSEEGVSGNSEKKMERNWE